MIVATGLLLIGGGCKGLADDWFKSMQDPLSVRF